MLHLMCWERKVLRKIYGPKKCENGWRIRTNEELILLHKSPDIVAEIKARRIQWASHVMRMEKSRDPRRTLEARMFGKRKRGRPRLRWIDCVEKDLRTLGVRRWRQKARDQQMWQAS